MIVVDTHAWLWWVNGDERRLSKSARRELDRASSVGVCAITVWEIARLVAVGRYRLEPDMKTWVSDALAVDRVELLPLSPNIAMTAASLGSAIHKDPADRMIVATALEHDVPIVTKDGAIRDAGIVRCIW